MFKLIFVAVWSIAVLIGTVVGLDLLNRPQSHSEETAASAIETHKTPILSIAVFSSDGGLVGHLTTKVETSFERVDADNPVQASMDVIIEDAMLNAARNAHFSREAGVEKANEQLSEIREGMKAYLAEKEPRLQFRSLEFVDPSLVLQ